MTWLEQYRLPFFCKTDLCFHYILCQEFLTSVKSPEGGKHAGVCGEKPGQLGCTASCACQSYSKVQIRAAFTALDVRLTQAVLWQNLRLKNQNQEQQAGIWWAGLFVSLQPEMRELKTAKLPTICSESKNYLGCVLMVKGSDFSKDKISWNFMIRLSFTKR